MEKNVLNTDLTGKVAVVTGASGTLCSILAKALARAGAKVALLGRNMDKLKELADKIVAEGGGHLHDGLLRVMHGQDCAGGRLHAVVKRRELAAARLTHPGDL